MSENTWQFGAMVDSATAHRARYRHNPDVLVGVDLLMYYEKGIPPTQQTNPSYADSATRELPYGAI